MRLRNSWRDLTSALKHGEAELKIDCPHKQEEKISLHRATEEVKLTLQETELGWEKEQSSIKSRRDDLETNSPRGKVG